MELKKDHSFSIEHKEHFSLDDHPAFDALTPTACCLPALPLNLANAATVRAVHVADKLGFGSAVVEERTLKDMDAMRFGGRVVMKAETKTRRYRMYTKEEMEKARKGVDEGVAKVVRYTDSTVASRQLAALSALIAIKSRNPVLADTYLTKHDAFASVRRVHTRLRLIQSTSTSTPPPNQLWHLFYSNPYSPTLLSSVLSRSHKALIFVEENAMHSVTKRLFEMGRVYCGDVGAWEGGLREFAGMVRHPALSILALAYISELSFHCDTACLMPPPRGKEQGQISLKVFVELLKSFLAIRPSKESLAKNPQGAASIAHFTQYARWSMEFLPRDLLHHRQETSSHTVEAVNADPANHSNRYDYHDDDDAPDIDLSKLGLSLYIASYMLLLRIGTYAARGNSKCVLEGLQRRYEELRRAKKVLVSSNDDFLGHEDRGSPESYDEYDEENVAQEILGDVLESLEMTMERWVASDEDENEDEEVL